MSEEPARRAIPFGGDKNEPNMAYDIIKDNIYTENMKQVGIKIIPNT